MKGGPEKDSGTPPLTRVRPEISDGKTDSWTGGTFFLRRHPREREGPEGSHRL